MSATESLSDRFCIASNGSVTPQLSPQYMLSCDSNDYGEQLAAVVPCERSDPLSFPTHDLLSPPGIGHWYPTHRPQDATVATRPAPGDGWYTKALFLRNVCPTPLVMGQWRCFSSLCMYYLHINAVMERERT